jgi:hypothetical protein
MNLQELLQETTSLPIDKRMEFVDLLLSSFQEIDQEKQKNWLLVAQSRREEILSGKMQKVDSYVVFNEVQKRFQK